LAVRRDLNLGSAGTAIVEASEPPEFKYGLVTSSWVLIAHGLRGTVSVEREDDHVPSIVGRGDWIKQVGSCSDSAAAM